MLPPPYMAVCSFLLIESLSSIHTVLLVIVAKQLMASPEAIWLVHRSLYISVKSCKTCFTVPLVFQKLSVPADLSLLSSFCIVPEHPNPWVSNSSPQGLLSCRF
ncbi:hypothetical protein ATANTOWER_013342 [Ataeniobius toweri]|uniref:Secreted protein n=1 Tax=Ataeniobius toweri TaxID=208326 RepID=A0ABU7A6Q2_9TELE|nr:hypothetical protein [Ataeniobius toweri]